jgi:exodeoxyribonuclease VII large subunit
MTLSTEQSRPLAARATETTRENPWPVRMLSQKMVEYIARAPRVWVEGQIAQLNARSTSGMVFLTLRDPSSDVSLQVTAFRSVFAGLGRPPKEGDRVVVHGEFSFYAARGSLSFRVDEVHPVGIGELLARLERIRALLAAEGLTAAEHKKPIPFLPHLVGLITGHASAAESDVLTNARLRWPAVQFRVENPVVQGPSAVPQILDALARLDADPDVDVIILARGGGSVEDLLPFSDETLCRAVAACRTPVISAIGHEPDHPIVDDVADVRCSTPTDAGKRVVPDAAAELRAVQLCRLRMRRALAGWVQTESARLARLTAAPSLADPFRPLQQRADDVAGLASRSLALLQRMLDAGDADLRRRQAQLAVLGPAATLARGYAVVQTVSADGSAVLRHAADAPAGTALRIRLGDGAIRATSNGTEEGR